MTPFDIASALPFALALRICIAAVTVLAAPRRGVALRVALLGSVAASLATGVAAVHVLSAGAAVNGVLFVHHASGFSLGYSIDGLSAWFLLVLSVVAIPIAIFSLGYLGSRTLEPPVRFSRGHVQRADGCGRTRVRRQ